MLLEQQADQPVPKRLMASLWLHLRYCPYCNRYAKQTVQIAQWARASASARAGGSDAVLSAAAKERMRQRLAATGE